MCVYVYVCERVMEIVVIWDVCNEGYYVIVGWSGK